MFFVQRNIQAARPVPGAGSLLATLVAIV